MTFLTNLEVTEMLCSLRLVPEGKAGIAIPESRFNFSKKFSANNFALSDAETTPQSYEL